MTLNEIEARSQAKIKAHILSRTWERSLSRGGAREIEKAIAFSEPERDRLFNCQIDSRLHERINRRAELDVQIAECAQRDEVGAFVYLEVWQRDCDCAEWSQLVKLRPATRQAFMAYCERVAENAEGSSRCVILTAREAQELRSEIDAGRACRDAALEAFEDGHAGHVIGEHSMFG